MEKKKLTVTAISRASERERERHRSNGSKQQADDESISLVKQTTIAKPPLLPHPANISPNPTQRPDIPPASHSLDAIAPRP